MKTSRRKFLKSSAALAGGLVIGFYLPETTRRAYAQAPQRPPVPPNAFLRIGKDGSVTVMVKHLEFGQGVTTSLPMIVAEELECDWSKVHYALAPSAPEYAHTIFGMQMTGGSSSVVNSWDQLRTVGAQARMMLMQAAADQWKVNVSQVRAENGAVIGPSGQRLTYGQLADAAARVAVPANVTLKDAKSFKVIGKPTRRIDSPEKTDGSAVFGFDMKRKDQLTAMVVHPPVFGARLKTFGADKVKGIHGVTHVVDLGDAVAVVGNHFWACKKAREALETEWDLGPNAKLSTAALSQQFRELARTPGTVAKKGDPAAVASAAKKIVAEYEVPFLAHAPMEPLNCTVEVRDDGAEIWVGSQFQTIDQQNAAKILGFKPEQVKLNTVLAGGGFGRRANMVSDYIVEACVIASKVKKPVKVVWTREDDIKGGYYRPMYVHRVEAGLDAQNKVAGWHHRVVGPSIVGGTAFEAMLVKDGVDPTSVEGIGDMPYAMPNLNVELHTVKAGVPVLWWRSVGHSHTGFVVETMIDELAAAAGKDPVAFRREMMGGQPRVLRVLDLAAEKSGWGSALPKGRARGIAVVESFGSVCAHVAEVSLNGNDIRVHKITTAFDCGLVVNPMTVEAQLQSAIAFGLSAALYSQITFKDGQVEQSNFHNYRVLRMNEMPVVEVHLVPGGDKPTGVGEPGVPPVAPAVANALFVLTGKRARALPLASQQWT